MAKKCEALPNKEQQAVMERHGLRPYLYTVVKELGHTMIIKHRVTGEFKVLDK